MYHDSVGSAGPQPYQIEKFCLHAPARLISIMAQLMGVVLMGVVLMGLALANSFQDSYQAVKLQWAVAGGLGVFACICSFLSPYLF